MPDPHDHDYRPRFEGREIGPVGTGSSFGADLFDLYVGGRVYLPGYANTFAEVASGLHSSSGGVDAYRPDLADAAMGAVARLLDFTQVAAGEAARNTRAVGESLVRLADLYASTDREAAESFAHYLDDPRRRDLHSLDDPPAGMPSPPSPSDPLPTLPDDAPPGLDRGPELDRSLPQDTDGDGQPDWTRLPGPGQGSPAPVAPPDGSRLDRDDTGTRELR